MTTTCTSCGALYEAGSEEQAHEPERWCFGCREGMLALARAQAARAPELERMMVRAPTQVIREAWTQYLMEALAKGTIEGFDLRPEGVHLFLASGSDPDRLGRIVIEECPWGLPQGWNWTYSLTH